MSDTPETDHLENELGQAARMSHPILWAQSRKLERERDEAREVLREIAEASGFDNIGNWARNKAKSAIYR